MDENIDGKNKRKEADLNGETALGDSEHSVSMDRRSFLTRSTLVAGGVLASPLFLASNGQSAQTQSPPTGDKEAIILPDFRFPLAQQPVRELPGGLRRRLQHGSFQCQRPLQVYS